ncbi:hypothetical protein ACNQ2K_02505 [Mycoplasma sp. VS292A]|uniref:hypothetical protein n=1 Tax=Mycoplasma sp. VS292A TaxID=3401680 RepID=UPI003AAE47AD
MQKQYISEIQGMFDFYAELGVTPNYDLNTDGVIKGTIIEFKKNKDLDGGVKHHIEQIIRYLKAYNSAGKKVPSKSYLIYLNSGEFIKFQNLELLETNGYELDEINRGKWMDVSQFRNDEDFVNNNEYLRGYIDEFSIISYNNLFCEMVSEKKGKKYTASKEEVKQEFINPQLLNIKPFDWNKQLKDEEETPRFGWLHFNMNMLGGVLLKKQLGAFFTPEQYVEISTNYVLEAIERSKKLGYKDYLIIDRCAGTGNLERLFNEEVLSHCILNTIDYTEWTTLKGLYEGRVREIIPPTNEYITDMGLLSDGDALSEGFNTYLSALLSKVNREETYLIFLENPPFRDETSTLSSKDKESRKHITYIDGLMVNDKKIKGALKNELATKFIWSAFNIYKPNEYILYSPIKYWKKDHIIDKKYFNGYISNRKNYNANYDAGLPIMNWSDVDDVNEELILENGNIKKIHNSIKTLLDKTKNNDYFAKMFIMAGELRPIGTSLDNGKQIINDTPCLLNEKNALEQLPLFAAAKYEPKDLELSILMKSGDGGRSYQRDNEFMNDCFIWACLTNKNKCISDDLRLNEMALSQNSRADNIFNSFKNKEKYEFIMESWNKILNFIKNTSEYISTYKYGLHQTETEINIKVWNGEYNKKHEKVFVHKYPELNDAIKYLKDKLNTLYRTDIEPKIFKYQLVK